MSKDELLEAKLLEYDNKFKDPFPRVIAYTSDEEYIINTIDECIKLNKKYEIPDDGNLY